MPIRVVRLGQPRAENEGLRIGTVRRPPRGVKKADYSKCNYYDVWLPELAPTAPLVSWALSEPFTRTRWATYERKYRREMQQAVPQRLIEFLAALSRQTNFSIGCYCEDEHHCHRSILKRLLLEKGAEFGPS